MRVSNAWSRAFALMFCLFSFVSYVVFHGFAGSYLFLIYSLRGEQFQLFGVPATQHEEMTRLLACVLAGTVIGAYSGALACLSHCVFKHKTAFRLRSTIAVVSSSLMGAGLLTMLRPASDWRLLAVYFIPGAVLGLITSLIAEAGRNPWDLLLRGGWRQRRDNRPLAILSGLGLRLGGLVPLLALILLLAAFLRPRDVSTLEELAIMVSVLAYFGLTTLVAFASPPRWLALGSGLLINVPTVILAISWWQAHETTVAQDLYLLLWVLFIAGRSSRAPRRSVVPGRMHKSEPAWVK
jgi:hypothetical protein